MEQTDKIPNLLFKYRHFNDQTLDMLVSDRIFFANPSTFNDPLDSKPSLKADIDTGGLERILTKLVEQRENAEMTTVAKDAKYSALMTTEYISLHSRLCAKRLIDNIRYDAGNPRYEEYEGADLYQRLLSSSVEIELLRRYDKGIFSLAEQANCPLMWSHYGDQHKGICVGYSVPVDVSINVHKIKYGDSRLIEAIKIAAMLEGDEAAQLEVGQAIFQKKAQDWQYENEWRVIGQHGLQNNLLELEEVIFGMRCPSIVEYAVAKALEGRERTIKFYRIRQKTSDGFLLEKCPRSFGELTNGILRRAPRANELFKAVPRV